MMAPKSALTERARRVRHPAGSLLAAALWLHALGALRYPWEKVAFHASWLRGSLDLAALLLLGGLAGLRWGRGAALGHILAVLLLLVPIFRFAVTVMPVFYGKELDVYNDIAMFPGLVHLLLHRHGLFVQAGLVLGTLAVSAGVYYATYRAWRRVLASVVAGSRRSRRGVFTVLAVFLLVGSFDLARDNESPLATAFLADDIGRAAVSIATSWREYNEYDRELEEARRRLDDVPTDLARLEGADVYVLFIESYGRCIFRDPERRSQLEQWSVDWLELLEAHGYSIRTAFAFPSVRGGNSSLAHAEFLSGVRTATRRTFDRLLASDLRSLPLFFREAGYRTISVQPAMPRAWEAGSFFGFDVDVFQPQLPYEGLDYHWGRMPDQYAMAYLLKEYVEPSQKPLFVQYVSVTSHAPFSMIPPYVPDWEVAATSAPFEGPPALDFGIGWVDYVGHPRLPDAYMESIRYSLDTAFRFLGELERDAFVFLLGDHQPPRVGPFQEADASFDVPVHVIAKDARFVDVFEPFGFQRGFFPPPETGNFATFRIMSSFLGSFSLGGSPSPADDRVGR